MLPAIAFLLVMAAPPAAEPPCAPALAAGALSVVAWPEGAALLADLRAGRVSFLSVTPEGVRRVEGCVQRGGFVRSAGGGAREREAPLLPGALCREAPLHPATAALSGADAAPFEGQPPRSSLRTVERERWQLVSVAPEPASGDCSAATHLVRAAHLGFYELRAESGLARTTSCEAAGAAHEDGCAAPLRLELEPVARDAAGALLPPPATDVRVVGPPGERWELESGQAARLCAVPCDLRLLPGSSLTLKDPASEARLVLALPPEPAPALRATIARKRDPFWPLAPVVETVLGAGGAAGVVALIAHGPPAPGPSTGGAAGVIGSSVGSLAGYVVGVTAISGLSLVLTAVGVHGLVQGPEFLPVLQVGPEPQPG